MPKNYVLKKVVETTDFVGEEALVAAIKHGAIALDGVTTPYEWLTELRGEQADYILTRDIRIFTRTAEELKKTGLLSAAVVHPDDSTPSYFGAV